MKLFFYTLFLFLQFTFLLPNHLLAQSDSLFSTIIVREDRNPPIFEYNREVRVSFAHKAIVGDFTGNGFDEILFARTPKLNSNKSKSRLWIIKPNHYNFVPVTAMTRRNVRTIHPDFDDWKLDYLDVFYPGDFDGNGKTDLMVFNPDPKDSCSFPSICLEGSSEPRVAIITLVDNRLRVIYKQKNYLGVRRRFAGTWNLSGKEVFLPGDFNRDGKTEILVANRGWIGLLKMIGPGLVPTWIRSDTIQATNPTGPPWVLKGGDRFLIGNFDDDDLEVLVYNNFLPISQTMAVLDVSGGQIRVTYKDKPAIRRQHNSAENWTFDSNTKLKTADLDGDGKSEIIVLNEGPDQIAILKIIKGEFRTTSITTDRVPASTEHSGSWILHGFSGFLPGDFDQDGKAEILVGSDNSLGILKIIDGELRTTSIKTGRVPASTENFVSVVGNGTLMGPPRSEYRGSWGLNNLNGYPVRAGKFTGFRKLSLLMKDGDYMGLLYLRLSNP